MSNDKEFTKLKREMMAMQLALHEFVSNHIISELSEDAYRKDQGKEAIDRGMMWAMCLIGAGAELAAIIEVPHAVSRNEGDDLTMTRRIQSFRDEELGTVLRDAYQDGVEKALGTMAATEANPELGNELFRRLKERIREASNGQAPEAQA